MHRLLCLQPLARVVIAVCGSKAVGSGRASTLQVTHTHARSVHTGAESLHDEDVVKRESTIAGEVDMMKSRSTPIRKDAAHHARQTQSPLRRRHTSEDHYKVSYHCYGGRMKSRSQREQGRSRRATAAAAARTIAVDLGNGIRAHVPTHARVRHTTTTIPHQRLARRSQEGETATAPIHEVAPSSDAAPSPLYFSEEAAMRLVASAQAAKQEMIAQTLTTPAGNRSCSDSGGGGEVADASASASSTAPVRSLAAPVDLTSFATTTVLRLLSSGEVLSSLYAVSNTAAMERVAELVAAQADLSRYLNWLESHVTRTTGRRYEAAFPASLVLKMWQYAMPALYDASQQLGLQVSRQQRRRQHESQQPQLGTHDPTVATLRIASPSVSYQPISALVPTPMRVDFQESFRKARRALAVRTAALADVLVQDSPDATVITLARMQHCGALADDVLAPVAAQLLEAHERASQAARGELTQPRAVNHTLAAHGAVATPLVNLPSTSLSPAAAMTLVRLLGRQRAPKHFQLHRLTHTVLLPRIRSELGVAAARVRSALAHSATEGSHYAAAATVAGEEEEKANGMKRGAAQTLSLEEAVPSRRALEDLTSSFVHYAVSGDVVESLTTLWEPYIIGVIKTDEAAAFTVADSTRLLRVLARPPAAAAIGAVRHPERLTQPASATLTDLYERGSQRRYSRRANVVAADEYVPLVEMLCGSVAATCQQYLSSASSLFSPSTADATTPSASPASLPPPELGLRVILEWIVALLKVDSPHWAEVYLLSASVALAEMNQGLLLHDPATGDGENDRRPTATREDGEGSERVAAVRCTAATMESYTVPITLVEQTVSALLARNSSIPDHPLHHALLSRLLHAPETIANPRYANTALMALELMTPPQPSPSSSAPLPPSGNVDSDHGGSLNSLTAPLAEAIVARVPMADSQAALRLLTHHDTALGPTAFVAAMCTAPVHQLPPAAQVRIQAHFTRIATALHPSWLARGIVAASQKLTSVGPSRDSLSVHRWFSRFTARDVVAKLELAQCAALLSVLSTHKDDMANNAIALHGIVRRVSTLLRAEDGGAAALEVIPTLVPALQAANAFFPRIFSRLCRLLLGEVSDAPWHTLLPAFAATADEFMARPPWEARGTVFRDVWELLRQRVMAEAAASMTLDDVLAALNGFAALDGGDRSLALVLTQRLWVAVTETETEGEAMSAAETRRPDAAAVPITGTQTAEEASDERVRRAHVRAAIGKRLCATLTSSATAMLAATLVHKGAGQDVDAMLPWTLVALASPTVPAARDLYPIDVVQLMPTLLVAFQRWGTEVEMGDGGKGEDALSTSSPATHGKRNMLMGQLLHRAYDAVRGQFLYMFEERAVAAVSSTGVTREGGATEGRRSEKTEPTGAPTAATTSEIDTAAANALLEERNAWPAKVRASVELVPKRYFAHILVELSASGIVDPVVATACAARVCTTRCCQELLTAQQLVDVCMALCMQFPPPASTASTAQLHSGGLSSEGVNDHDGNSSNSEGGSSGGHDERGTPTEQDMPLSSRTADAEAPHKEPSLNARFMPAVLNALWRRTDELRHTQTEALLRCLQHTYGPRVDTDFVQRLRDHQQELAGRKASVAAARQAREVGVVDTKTAGTQAESTVKPGGVEQASTAAPPPPPLDGMGESVAMMMMDSLSD